jgi:hypothetical protein
MVMKKETDYFISEEDNDKIDTWLHTVVYPAIIKEQKARILEHPEQYHASTYGWSWENGYPYEGAIGGGLTYSFTPNSIGVAFNVKYGEYKLDLTSYENW